MLLQKLKHLPFLLLLLFYSVSLVAQESVLKKGMVISRSVRIKKMNYQLTAPGDSGKSVIVIEGDNITVDFNGASMKGSRTGALPDQFSGVAIVVRKGKNITIKNLSARGYKIALLARNIEGLKIENCDFSYNYRQHLNSSQEKEDISDWMSYHHNEKDEWLRYGAAIYLRGCNNAVISNCKVQGGQNALMMMESNNGMIFNNDFSFNSGIGIGMYKSSNNKILYNKIDFNVRGYSHGVYNRGQDSAGILVYEQSNSNLFYKNSVTHGGDGFFLWAGQTTMDTGKGGCNDNILFKNDFSYAPTNGIEVTFSRNQIIDNRIFECDHGIWGGYSFNSVIKNNQFRENRIAIAIEHGQENNIHYNLFIKDKEAIRLWARKEQPADWGYARNRDTRSRNYNIVGNSFNNHPLVFNLNRTDSLKIFENRISFSDVIFKIDSTVTNLDSVTNEILLEQLSADSMIDIPKVTRPQDAFKGAGKLAGRKNILISEWGPYNFRYPLLWNNNPTDSSDQMRFDLKGPAGKWRLISFRGVEMLSKRSGSFPDSFRVKKTRSDVTDIEIIAEYSGASFMDAFGNTVPSGKPHKFVFRKFFQPIAFNVRWFAYDSASNPIKANSVAHIEKLAAFKTEKVVKLDYAWWGGIRAGAKQHSQFLTIADGSADISPGMYELAVTWDDAVRVYLDDKLLIDEWNPSKYLFDESPNRKVQIRLGGHHRFRVEHVELGGFATLSLKLKKLNPAP